jgi:UDP-glucose:O-linked fucose beta-1,3-glucosyltransferase
VKDLYFGIKTFVGYHQSRLDLLRKTWLNVGLNYHLFTNVLNETIDDPNERFIITKENTERGHCHKTFFILNHFHKKQKDAEYLLIVDDDTLISVQRVLRLIRCFMLSKDIPTVLGERYGYGHYYDYPTGGSGIILNRQAVKEIVAHCECPSADTPDDMFLGMCLKRIEIPLTHIPELHQAQPNAYSKDWLAHLKSISFHKFEHIPVEEIYRTYLHEEVSRTKQSPHVKDEF